MDPGFGSSGSPAARISFFGVGEYPAPQTKPNTKRYAIAPAKTKRAMLIIGTSIKVLGSALLFSFQAELIFFHLLGLVSILFYGAMRRLSSMDLRKKS